MKKFLFILIGFALAVGVFGVAGFVYAQTQGPEETPFPCPFCDGDRTGRGGMMAGRFGGRGSFGPGMMSDDDGEYGPMHETMSAAIAEAFGLSVDELEALHDDGTTLWTYAESQGMTAEEFQTLMLDVRKTSIEQAVVDGTLTQEQGDWMLDRMEQMQENGFGTGNCGGGFRGQRGGRGKNQ